MPNVNRRFFSSPHEKIVASHRQLLFNRPFHKFAPSVRPSAAFFGTLGNQRQGASRYFANIAIPN